MQQIIYMKNLKTFIIPLMLLIVLQSCDNEESDIQTEIKINHTYQVYKKSRGLSGNSDF